MSATVLGIEKFTAPSGFVNRGRFSLPPEFDSQKFSAKWVEHGPKVVMAQDKEVIQSEGVRVPGWAVWKDSKGKPCLRTVSKGAFVLMFQPKALRQAINKIRGNQSRRRMVKEAKGETVTANPQDDKGVLSAQKLQEMGIESSSEPAFEGDVTFNDLSSEAAEEATIIPAKKPKSNTDFLRKKSD
jgi:hypothetical protein